MFSRRPHGDALVNPLWENLYHAADQALYRAKQGGCNRVEFG